MFQQLIVRALVLVAYLRLASASPVKREAKAAVNWSSIDWSKVDWNKVDWNNVDWNNVDWSKVDWSKVDWDSVDWSAVQYNTPGKATSPQPSAGKTALSTQSGNIGLTGPVITSNFPDPSVIRIDGVWYAFATETVGSNVRVQMASSSDFTSWTVHSGYDALAQLPSWANPTTYRNVWAPDVAHLDDGTFIMYFSALVKGSPSHHCIGAATSPTVQGPYIPREEPLICPEAGRGAIDASGFKDWTGTLDTPGAQRYVAWKEEVDGTPILIRPVAQDGVTFTGPATTLLSNRGALDGFVTEAPQLVKTGPGDYFLFFSTGDFATASYTVSYATASSPTGPFVRKGALITSQSAGIKGPGGMDVDPSGTRMVLAAVEDEKSPVPDRGMWVTGIKAKNGRVTLD